MLRTRVIPALLLKNAALVKTIRFREPNYIGDPINTVRIFNEEEVDELVFLDITATTEKREPNFELVSQITNECFMPLAYGGGLRTVDQVQRMFSLGIEKVVINSYAAEEPYFIRQCADLFGSQSIVVSVDAKMDKGGTYGAYSHSGTRPIGCGAGEFAVRMERMGAGELFLNSIDRDGTFEGFDVSLISAVTRTVSVPVIACGGAGSVEDLGRAVKEGGASAVAAGSLFVYSGRNRAVLVNFPPQEELKEVLG